MISLLTMSLALALLWGALSHAPKVAFRRVRVKQTGRRGRA